MLSLPNHVLPVQLRSVDCLSLSPYIHHGRFPLVLSTCKMPMYTSKLTSSIDRIYSSTSLPWHPSDLLFKSVNCRTPVVIHDLFLLLLVDLDCIGSSCLNLHSCRITSLVFVLINPESAAHSTASVYCNT